VSRGSGLLEELTPTRKAARVLSEGKFMLDEGHSLALAALDLVQTSGSIAADPDATDAEAAHLATVAAAMATVGAALLAEARAIRAEVDW